MNSRSATAVSQESCEIPVPLQPSRFNMWTRSNDGTLVVFNSFSSALLEFRGDTSLSVEHMLRGDTIGRGELEEFLATQSVLVPKGCGEMEIARKLHEQPFEDEGSLGLMLLSHENCNFRCKYCYEDFKRGRMLPEVVVGILALIRKRAPGLRSLSIGWFGGEPLLAFDLVERIATGAREICATHGVRFSSNMTTNGSLLEPERAARCVAAGINRYQVTIDGPAETHNRMRPLAGGGPTFDTIISNLRHLRDCVNGFHVALRVNFSPDNLERMPEFVGFLGTEFGHDSRFSIRFRPVGKWGGPNDGLIQICGKESGINQEFALMKLASKAGFGLQTWSDGMQVFGSLCYAASPRHFIIGSDGTVYKCSVAFNDPRNHVGYIDAAGNLNLEQDLVRLWTRSGEETDSDCQECNFRPACQGNLCPLERINGEKRCPTMKTHFAQIAPLIAEDARRSLGSVV
jgi:uncharacterized protein